jgi:hypothetical protein
LEDEAADLAQIIIIGADIPPTDLGNRVAIAFVDNTQKDVVSSPEKLAPIILEVIKIQHGRQRHNKTKQNVQQQGFPRGHPP